MRRDTASYTGTKYGTRTLRVHLGLGPWGYTLGDLSVILPYYLGTRYSSLFTISYLLPLYLQCQPKIGLGQHSYRTVGTHTVMAGANRGCAKELACSHGPTPCPVVISLPGHGHGDRRI